MANDITKLKTPGEFIEYYSSQLKDYLDKYDIQINKLGLIGFILNLLGNLHFDTKQYYDYLFKEAFIATAMNNNNLYMHSYNYGFKPSLATPSTAYGNFVFDFAFLPTLNDVTLTYKAKFSDIVFNINGIIFSSRGITITFIKAGNNSTFSYSAVIIMSDGTSKYIPSGSSQIVVPFYEIFQEEIVKISTTLPEYSLGSFYSFPLNFEKKFLSDLKVLVQVQNSNIYEEYSVSRLKYLGSSFEKTCFLSILEDTSYLLEFGSGEHGAYIPNTSVDLTEYITLGQTGNLNISKIVNLDSAKVNLTKTNQSNDVFTLSISILDILQVNFEHSEQGVDILKNEKLRESLVKYIQTRDNWETKTDFYNLTNDFSKDFKFLFKKTSFMENNFYLFKTFRNKLQLPVKTLNLTIKIIDETNTPTLSVNTTTGGELLDDFNCSYYVFESNEFNYSDYSSVTILTGTSSNLNLNNINLSFSQSGCVWFYIFIDDLTNIKCFRTTATQLNHVKNEGSIDDLEIVNNIDDIIEYLGIFTGNIDEFKPVLNIFKPTFKTQNNVFSVSPFLFNYDDQMNWYNGRVLNEDIIIQTKVTDSNKSDENNHYFRIIYDKINDNTKIQVKSLNDISANTYHLMINILNINSDMTNNIDENTWEYIYDGIIFDSFDIELKVNSMTLKTELIEQVVDISDQLKLWIYDNEYIINIPLINVEEFNSNKLYFENSIYSFINETINSDNRLVTDEVQVRFLNSESLPDTYINSVLKPQNILGIKQLYQNSLVFPLKLEVIGYLNQDYLDHNYVNLTDEQKLLIHSLVDFLNGEDYSGVNIKCFTSKIIDFVHTDRLFLKKVEIIITDSSDNNDIILDLEVYEDEEILSNILNSTYSPEQNKKDYLNYTPTMFWWDINNIKVNFILG